LPGAFVKLVRPALDHAETAIARVQALGFAARDVRHVVVTHLDLDHAGGIADFPDATIHVHAREHAAAMAPPTVRERERYRKTHWAHGPKWAVYTEDGDTWRGLPAIAKLRGLDADVGLVPMHGHTRGHSAVIAKSGERWLVHAGDAYFHRNEMGEGKVPLALRAFESFVETDKAARRASASALRQLRASYSDVALFCAHDTEEFAALA
jgi:glyoxylase-like metal-dependent hydrolase (beta-lactamase superfamily II)